MQAVETLRQSKIEHKIVDEMRVSLDKFKVKEMEVVETLKEDIEEEGVEQRQKTKQMEFQIQLQKKMIDDQDHQIISLEQKIRKFEGKDDGLARRADQQGCIRNMLPTIIMDTKEVKEKIKRVKKEQREEITILQVQLAKAQQEMKLKETEMKQVEMILRVEKREAEPAQIQVI